MTEKQAIAPLPRAPTTTCNTPIARLIEKMFAQGCEPAAIISAVEAIEQLKPGRRTALTMRGARLSESWQPSADDIAYALDRGIPQVRIANEAEKFRNYWVAKTGSGATKRDWRATWRNWIINATERSNGNASHNRGQRGAIPIAGRAPTGADAILAGMGRIARRIIEKRDAARPGDGKVARGHHVAPEFDLGPDRS